MLLLEEKLKAHIKEIVIKHEAKSEQELCGYIDKSKKLTLVQNKSIEPANNFEFDIPNNVEIVAVFHTHWRQSHENKLTFSDLQIAHRKKIPLILYHTYYDSWDYYDPNYPHPYPLLVSPELTPKDIDWYKNHEYSYGRSDCYSIVKDWYQGMLDIQIEPGDRYDTDSFSHKNPFWNRFVLELSVKGRWKIKTGNLSLNDLILFRIDNVNPNHCGVVVELLNNDAKILHQYGGRRTSEIISLNSIRRCAALCYYYDI